MPYAPQNLVSQMWEVIDLNNPPGVVSGLTAPADVTLALRRSSGTTSVVASETVSWAESGTAGNYVITFVPQNAGTYVLTLQEVSVLTTQRRWSYSYEVLPAGAVFTPSYANAFCAETDVERYAGLSFTNTSEPVNSSMVAGFVEERAAALMSLCSFWGLSVTPSSVTVGSRLEDILRSANAIGAAFDAVVAWYTQVEPAENEKARSLLARWLALVGDGQKLMGQIQMEISGNLVSLTTSNILSGDTTARANEGSPQDIGLQIRMGDLY